VLTALYHRERTGTGCHIETSLFEAGVGWVNYQLAGYLGSGKMPGRMASRMAMIAPYAAFATRDAYLLLAAPNDQIFRRLCRLLEVSGLPDDDRFRTNSDRVAQMDELHAILEERLKTKPARHWEDLFAAERIPCSRVRTLDEVAADPQVEALGLLMSVSHPAIPELRLVDLPLSLNGMRAARRDPPPELGQHTDEILRRLGYEREHIELLRRTGVIF